MKSIEYTDFILAVYKIEINNIKGYLQKRMFSDVLFESLAGLTHEQLYENAITLIDGLGCEKLTDDREVMDYKEAHKNDIEQLMLITGEMYRREIAFDASVIMCLKQFLEGDCCAFCGSGKNIDYTFSSSVNVPIHGTHIFTPNNLLCNKCYNIHKQTTVGTVGTQLFIGENTHVSHISVSNKRQVWLYSNIVGKLTDSKGNFNLKLQQLRAVKEIMLNILKTPILTKKLEECLDEILDLNGNKISQLKPHLTEEQYRFVRSGTKFEEFTDQEDLLTRFTTLLSDLRKPPLITTDYLH